MEYVDVAWAASSALQADRISTSPTANRLPSFINLASARRSAAPGLRRKLMLRLVVTASATRPIALSIHGEVGERHHGGPRYGAARANEVIPVGLANLRPAAPNVLDEETAARIEHLRKLRAQETLQFALRERRLAAAFGPFHCISQSRDIALEAHGITSAMSITRKIYGRPRASFRRISGRLQGRPQGRPAKSR